jgi:hypothetical protein
MSSTSARHKASSAAAAPPEPGQQDMAQMSRPGKATAYMHGVHLHQCSGSSVGSPQAKLHHVGAWRRVLPSCGSVEPSSISPHRYHTPGCLLLECGDPAAAAAVEQAALQGLEQTTVGAAAAAAQRLACRRPLNTLLPAGRQWRPLRRAAHDQKGFPPSRQTTFWRAQHALTSVRGGAAAVWWCNPPTRQRLRCRCWCLCSALLRLPACLQCQGYCAWGGDSAAPYISSRGAREACRHSGEWPLRITAAASSWAACGSKQSGVAGCKGHWQGNGDTQPLAAGPKATCNGVDGLAATTWRSKPVKAKGRYASILSHRCAQTLPFSHGSHRRHLARCLAFAVVSCARAGMNPQVCVAHLLPKAEVLRG